jgi:hypothetical protein
MINEALAQFEASEGYFIGVNASVTPVSVGASAQITSDAANTPCLASCCRIRVDGLSYFEWSQGYPLGALARS